MLALVTEHETSHEFIRCLVSGRCNNPQKTCARQQHRCAVHKAVHLTGCPLAVTLMPTVKTSRSSCGSGNIIFKQKWHYVLCVSPPKKYVMCGE